MNMWTMVVDNTLNVNQISMGKVDIRNQTTYFLRLK